MSGTGRSLLLALSALALVPSAALAQDEPVKERGIPGPPRTPLEQAREEAGEPARAPTRYALPEGELRVTPSELLASSVGRQIRFEATLDRPRPGARVSVRLPPAWVRTPASGIRASRPPRAAAGDRLARDGRDVQLRFGSGERRAAFTIENTGIPAGTYELPLRARTPAGRTVAAGSARVRVFAAVREAGEGDAWRRFPRAALNASDDTVEQSEAFVAVTPVDERRYALGINGADAMTAFVTQDGGQTFARDVMPATTDAPGETGAESSDICCDPMFAAGDGGDLWFGGLSLENGAANPSRIVVNRIAAGETSFRDVTVGLPLSAGTNGTQDKPLMTVDNAPSSPTYGRLYVVWDEPIAAGVRVAISRCDTRPGGGLDAARCDSADNWSAPAPVTAEVGSYIYPDVAVGPDGRVFVTWWDYSSTNAIMGAIGQDGTSFSAPRTIALLDDTGGRPLPFGCPILVQPGGRVGPAPGVEVDRSLGSHRGRVYVSWGDLRPGSGTTRCEGLPNGTFTPPLSTHLSWDGFVASRDGDLPGSPAASASVGTRLFTDGTAGDPPSSDEFFPWVAVDQANGDVWADFYSTRDDPTRTTTHFYARSVAPDGSGGHDLGPLERLSTAASSYATSPCCTFGNDFGDYEAIDAARCVPLPAWSDNSSGTPRDGEAFTFDSLRGPVCFQDVPALTEGPGADGDGRFEPGEAVTVAVRLRNAGTAASTAVTGALTPASAGATVTEGSASWPAIPAGGTADPSQAFRVELGAADPCQPFVVLALALSAPPRSQTAALTVPVACPAPPAPTPTPAPPPPAPSPGPGPGSNPAPLRAHELGDFDVDGRQSLRTVLRRGVQGRLFCFDRCDAVLTLRLDARTARRSRLPRQIGRLGLRVAGGRYRVMRVRLSSRARRALRRARTVKLTARATVDPREVLSRRVTLRR